MAVIYRKWALPPLLTAGSRLDHQRMLFTVLLGVPLALAALALSILVGWLTNQLLSPDDNSPRKHQMSARFHRTPRAGCHDCLLSETVAAVQAATAEKPFRRRS
jgi:hypothetical protein